MSTPFVSIIMPTHNRVDLLPQTLSAICQQTYPAHRFELIVIADGCIDSTAHFVNNYEAPFVIQLIEQSGKGPSTARNVGAKQAQGDILIFIDDDIEVSPQFISAHVANHSKNDPTIVLGALPIAGEGSGDLFDKSIRQWWKDKFAQLNDPDYRFRYGDLYTGNVSMSAALFHDLAGFNTDLWCHEDYEFGIRAAQANAVFKFSYEASGLHHDKTDLRRSLRRRIAEGNADVYLARRYPKLRYQLPLSVGHFSVLSRVLRFLAFKLPALGRLICQLFLWALLLVKNSLFKQQWRALFYHVQDFYYWLGVAESVSHPTEVKELFEALKPIEWQDSDQMCIDLTMVDKGLGQQIDQARPNSVRFMAGSQWVADSEPLFGAEKLLFRHLRPLINQHLGDLTLGLTMTKLNHSLEPTNFYNQSKAKSIWLKSYPTATFYNTPKLVREVDVCKPLSDMAVPAGHDIYLLVKAEGEPLGWLELFGLKTTYLSADFILSEIKAKFGWQIVPTVWKRPFVQHQPATEAITAIVCTRNRADQLGDCLDALRQQTHSNYSILVIDNAPSDNSTQKVVSTIAKQASVPISYVREDRPGLDWARNRGIQEAQTPLIAFTDDDARPDTNWLSAIAKQFEAEEITAVTGPTLPSELTTPYQNLFEFGYGGMSHGFERRFIRPQYLKSNHLLWASSFGVGANMAFRKSIFEHIGGFDEALDVGTPSNGGGDIELFHRLVAHGHTLLYEPTAFVWHMHRQTEADLRRHMANNGRGFGVYLLTCGRNKTVSWPAIVHFWLRHWLWQWIIKRLIKPSGFPRALILQELSGGLQSIWAYYKAQKQAKTIKLATNQGKQKEINLVKVN